MSELSASDWRATFSLLDAALDVPADQRDLWVGALTGDDARLVPVLRGLLARRAAIETAEFLARLPVFTRVGDESSASDAGLAPGGRIGPYVLLEPLGSGGMSTVWLAERADGLMSRRVALKLPHAGWALPDFAARLAQERELLASLEHPRIARLYDAGVAEDGRPWLALEAVYGQPIDAYCAAHALPVRARLNLVLQIAQAVAYAHSRLIVHRDLKPSNVLVDDNGEVHLLDFGIGKLLDPAGASASATRFGARAFTPDYASPEQLRGDPVTTATDIYSLGVVLYELLAGRRPHRSEPGSSLEHAVATLEPPPPSRVAEPGSLKRELDVDLDAITLEALDKNPTERYPTVAAFAEDIERYLHGEPVQARRGAHWYRTAKFLRRHWLVVAAAALVFFGIVGGGAIALWQASVARTEAARAEAVQQFLLSIFRANSRDQPDPLRARATTARELLDASAARLRSRDGARLPAEARDELRSVISRLYVELGMYDEATALDEARVASLRTRGRAAEVELGMALVELASSLQQTDRSVSALPLLREAEAIAARHPADERLAGYVASYLANQLTSTGVDVADRYAERAVALLHRAEPRGDEMLGALLMLATTKRTSDPAAAEHAASEALDLVAATRGTGHQLYGETALVLAQVQASRLETTADTTYKAADLVALKVTEPGHYLRLQTDLRYGLFLAEHDLPGEAATRLTRALAAAIKTRGADDSIYVGWSYENLARAALRRGRLDEAALHVNAALHIYRAQERDDTFAKVAELACDIALARGDRPQARALLDEARSTRTSTGTIRQPGFREIVAVREAWLLLADGDVRHAAERFAAVSGTTVPPLQRFLEAKIGARVGAARAARLLNDPTLAANEARAALGELADLGNPLPLRPLATEAWLEVAANATAAGHCPQAREAWTHAAEMLAATDDKASFRQAWLTSVGTACRTASAT
ncbi:MAG: serine/threonine protein kinase with repeat [Gammaproteobacteria bacterium]|nr:serine/threonine protein kinase with repeat [Gammaproteobacteria bacterium]